MELIEVGSVLPAMAGKGEGVFFEADGAGYTLIYNFASPTKDEIDATKEGKPFEIRFVAHGCVLWILSRCATLNWTDAPYTPHLSAGIKNLQRPSSENEGNLLTLIMTDARSGIVMSLRAIGLGHRFSVSLFDAIQDMLKRPFDPQKYQLDMMYAMVKSTNDLVRMSQAYYKLR